MKTCPCDYCMLGGKDNSCPKKELGKDLEDAMKRIEELEKVEKS